MEDLIRRIDVIRSINKIKSEMGFVNVDSVKKCVLSIPRVESMVSTPPLNAEYHGMSDVVLNGIHFNMNV